MMLSDVKLIVKNGFAYSYIHPTWYSFHIHDSKSFFDCLETTQKTNKKDFPYVFDLILSLV